jgi:hypothetical protein
MSRRVHRWDSSSPSDCSFSGGSHSSAGWLRSERSPGLTAVADRSRRPLRRRERDGMRRWPCRDGAQRRCEPPADTGSRRPPRAWVIPSSRAARGSTSRTVLSRRSPRCSPAALRRREVNSSSRKHLRASSTSRVRTLFAGATPGMSRKSVRPAEAAPPPAGSNPTSPMAPRAPCEPGLARWVPCRLRRAPSPDPGSLIARVGSASERGPRTRSSGPTVVASLTS